MRSRCVGWFGHVERIGDKTFRVYETDVKSARIKQSTRREWTDSVRAFSKQVTKCVST